MKKQAFFLVILSLFYHSIAGNSNQNKLVIGSRYGGFFTNFLAAINNLSWCEKHNVAPVINWSSRFPYAVPGGYYGKLNPWEYYFEPVSEMKYEPSDSIHASYFAPDGSVVIPSVRCAVNVARKKRAKFLIDHYIRIRNIIQEKIDLFFTTYMKDRYTIGLHLRGTDKNKEIKQKNPHEIIAIANNIAEELGQKCQFLVATDEQYLLELAQKELKKPVVFYPAYRSENGKPIHLRSINKAQLGEEVLIEVLLLSRCNYFIHTISNVSCAVTLFNPELQTYIVK